MNLKQQLEELLRELSALALAEVAKNIKTEFNKIIDSKLKQNACYL